MQSKTGPAEWFAEHGHAAAVPARGLVHNCQPKPAATPGGVGRGGPAVERLEDVLEFVGGNSQSLVSNADLHIALLSTPGGDSDRAAVGCVAERVVEQIDYCLAKRVGIARNRG